MKTRTLLFAVGLALCLSAAAQTVPAVTPAVNNARIKVVGQNMHNYFLNLNNSFSECKTQEALDVKTNKIATVFAAMDADVYAMCELEVSDTVVGYITRALNEQVGENRYAYIHDGIEDAAADGYTKVGFIYRTTKVRPLSTTSKYTTGSNTTVYGRRMRWIGFEETATGEKFIVSMNHFKAKVSGDDQGESQRITNAANLISAMNTMKRTDPDILVLGDLNAETVEQPIQNLIAAGLAEQLVRFNANAYSYRYQGQNQLIDHAMANASCANQIVGAGVSHLATGGSSLKFSDHDLYMVGLNPGDHDVPMTDPVVVLDESFGTGMGDFSIYDVSVPEGINVWTWDARYGMKATAYVNATRNEADSRLLSPELELPANSDITLTFDHTYRYTSTPQQDLTLAVSTDCGNNPAAATWTPLTIPTYPSGSDWTFVSSGAIDLSAYAGETITLSWNYASTAIAAATWEVKNVKVVATPKVVTPIETVEPTAEPAAQKMLFEGRIYILRADHIYDAMGRLVK